MFNINNCGENMFPELIIVKKKRGILLVYFLPNTNRKKFFEDIFVRLSKILGKYDSIILASDLNIDELTPC